MQSFEAVGAAPGLSREVPPSPDLRHFIQDISKDVRGAVQHDVLDHSNLKLTREAEVLDIIDDVVHRYQMEAFLTNFASQERSTLEHSMRDVAITLNAAIDLGIADKISLEGIAVGGLVHDDGKLYDQIKPIVQLPRKLTPRETEIVSEHPLRGLEFFHNSPHLRETLKDARVSQIADFLTFSHHGYQKTINEGPRFQSPYPLDLVHFHPADMEELLRENPELQKMGLKESISDSKMNTIGQILAVADYLDATKSGTRSYPTQGSGDTLETIEEDIERHIAAPHATVEAVAKLYQARS